MDKYYKVVAENRKAYHYYHVLEVYSGGLALRGSEVKSLRGGGANLGDSFGRVESGEIWLYNMHISLYERAQEKVDPYRKRKLLFTKQELKKLIGKTTEKGLTLIPLKVYFSGDWAKVDLGLAKSKKEFHKKEELIKKSVDKDIMQALKRNR